MSCGYFNESYVLSVCLADEATAKNQYHFLACITHYIYLAFLGISSKHLYSVGKEKKRKDPIVRIAKHASKVGYMLN